jgi:hypothetical protein
VQDLWFNEGDIAELLNDKKSYAGLPFAQPDDTQSLLNSRRMCYRLLKVFDDMDKDPGRTFILLAFKKSASRSA